MTTIMAIMLITIMVIHMIILMITIILMTMVMIMRLQNLMITPIPMESWIMARAQRVRMSQASPRRG